MKKFFALFLLLSLGIINNTFLSYSLANESIEKVIVEENILTDIFEGDKNHVEKVTNVVSSLLETQTKELDEIELEKETIFNYLKDNILNFRAEIRKLEASFQNIKLIFQSSHNNPAELTILINQNKRLIYDLELYSTPFVDILDKIETRLTQLRGLKTNLNSLVGINTEDISERVLSLTNSYTTYHNSLFNFVPHVEGLLKEIKDTNAGYEKIMPEIWLDYYLYNSFDLFSISAWINELGNFNKVPANMALLLKSELPQNVEGWVTFFVRSMVNIFILGVLILLSQKGISFLPTEFENLWGNILKKSMPYIVIGLTLRFVSYDSGNYYHIISSIGSVFLCYGQIRLAWQIFKMNREVLYEKSPLIIMVYPYAMALILLAFVTLPLTVSIIWILFTLLMLFKLFKIKFAQFHLPHHILSGFKLVMIINFFLTLLGFTRLSMLFTTIYICLGVGLHQVVACLSVSNLAQKYFPQKGFPALFSGLLHALIMPFVLFIAIASPLVWIFAYPGGQYLIENLNNFDFSFGEVTFNAVQVINILIVFYLVRSLIDVACSYIDNSSRDYNDHSIANLATPIKTTVVFGLYGLFVLYVLAVIGFSLASLAVVAGGLSVGIGLGLQGVMQNLFSGLSLIFGRNIREGDVVEVSGIFGEVKKVSLRATQVRTYDNAIVFVPNSEFLATSFTNWTHNGRRVRCSLSVGVGYGSDMKQVMTLVEEITKKQDFVLNYPAPSIYFMNFGASSLDLELRFWINNLDYKLTYLTEMRLAINQAFRDHNIEIPFPQTDLHLKSMPETVQEDFGVNPIEKRVGEKEMIDKEIFEQQVGKC